MDNSRTRRSWSNDGRNVDDEHLRLLQEASGEAHVQERPVEHAISAVTPAGPGAHRHCGSQKPDSKEHCGVSTRDRNLGQRGMVGIGREKRKLVVPILRIWMTERSSLVAISIGLQSPS